MIPAHWIRPKRIVHGPGVRSGDLADIQLICGAGAYAVDVIVCEHKSPGCVEFVGQVMQGENLDEPVANIRLLLVDPAGPAAHRTAQTDEFGEFDLESSRTHVPLGLRLGDAPDAPCVLVWDVERIEN